MAEAKTAVETKDQKAATEQGVEIKDNGAPVISDEDYLAALEAKDKEIERIASERDNYKQGLLKAKGKKKDDDDEDLDPVEQMRQIAREEFLKTNEAQLRVEKDAIIKKALKENSELKLALKNRSQKNNAAAGASSEEAPAPKDNFLSDQQVASLKAKGWDDKKIELFKQNLQRRRG